jgi:excinuclease ABC subunit C
MVVAGEEGLSKTHYRIFNVKSAELPKGDDTAMMRQMLARRFNIKKDKPRTIESPPDLIILDGGKGQMRAVLDIAAHFNIPVLAMAKGAEHGRKRERAGQTENFFYCKNAAKGIEKKSEIGQLTFLNNDPLFYYLQNLRDEAHRFAIGRHRAKRKKSTLKNPLDDIVGIGAKRKRALLARFGSAKAAGRASPKELESVDGISKQKAQMIYEYFHE